NIFICSASLFSRASHDPANAGNEPDDRAERGTASEEDQDKTNGAKVVVSMGARIRCHQITERTQCEQARAKSRGADDQKHVLNISPRPYGITTLPVCEPRSEEEDRRRGEDQ